MMKKRDIVVVKEIVYWAPLLLLLFQQCFLDLFSTFKKVFPFPPFFPFNEKRCQWNSVKGPFAPFKSVTENLQKRSLFFFLFCERTIRGLWRSFMKSSFEHLRDGKENTLFWMLRMDPVSKSWNLRMWIDVQHTGFMSDHIYYFSSLHNDSQIGTLKWSWKVSKKTLRNLLTK